MEESELEQLRREVQSLKAEKNIRSVDELVAVKQDIAQLKQQQERSGTIRQDSKEVKHDTRNETR